MIIYKDYDYRKDVPTNGFVEYVRINYNPTADILELENHLAMNGYNFGIDRHRCYLFVYIDELAYVETILTDRDIIYEVLEA